MEIKLVTGCHARHVQQPKTTAPLHNTVGGVRGVGSTWAGLAACRSALWVSVVIGSGRGIIWGSRTNHVRLTAGEATRKIMIYEEPVAHPLLWKG